jgi:hypothetical protein
MKKKSLKLFIWRGIREDTDGIGFAVATTKEEAIEAIHKISEDWEWTAYAGELLLTNPEVHKPPYGGWISGGGKSPYHHSPN